MAEFQFTTSGHMTIRLEGLAFGRHIKDPRRNVKTFTADPEEIALVANDMGDFTDWGRIELHDRAEGRGTITVTVTSETWGWFGTAQIALIANGQYILNDNFQSGVKGPVGDPSKMKRYSVGNID